MNLPQPTEVGARLRKLAQRVEARDEALSRQVRSLADAMTDPAIAAVWLDLDPLRVLTAERLARQRGKRYAFVRGLEWLRNALMLAPIGLTWWAVGQAVKAYGQALSKHPELSNQTFLYLWQTGFDHSDGTWLSLSVVAFLDVVIVAVIVTLILAVPALERWLGTGRLEADLQAAVTDASICLPRAMYGEVLQRGGAAPVDGAGAALPIDEPSAQMAVIRAAADVSTRLERVVASQSELNRRLAETLETARVAAARISDDSDAVRTAVGSLVSDQSQFLNALAKQTEAQSGTARNLQAVSEHLEQTLLAAEYVGPAMRELANYLDHMNKNLPPLLETLRRGQSLPRQ